MRRQPENFWEGKRAINAFVLQYVIGQPIFWPKSLKFWLYNLKFWLYFWPIHFLHLQLQNNSGLGVEVNPEAYSCTQCFEIKKNRLLGWYGHKYIKNYSRVKRENIIKLKHYMHNGLSIYQTKCCKTTFLALSRLSYIIFNRPVVCKTTLLRHKS